MFDLGVTGDISKLLVIMTREILVFLIKNKPPLGQSYREEWLNSDKTGIFYKIAKSISKDGNLKEEMPTSRSGIVIHKSPIDKDTILKKPPNEQKSLLLEWNKTSTEYLENSFLETGREGLSLAIEEAISENFGWSLKFAKFVKKNNVWELHALGNTLFKGWAKSTLSESQWEQALKFISSNRKALTSCNDDVIRLIDAGISSKTSPIPSSLYSLCLELLIKCIKLSSIESYLVEKKANWFSSAINSPTGRATEAIFNIIAKSKDSWTHYRPVKYRIDSAV